MAPLYKPPTKVTTTQVPWLSIVQRADPNFERAKHHEQEYAPWYSGQGRTFYADPYRRGAYNTPTKTTRVNYAGPVTLGAGDITGVGFDFVTLISLNAAPGTFTTRSAAQMFGDINNAGANLGYALRIVNDVNGGPITLQVGDGVLLFDRGGYPHPRLFVRGGTYSDFSVTFTDSAHAEISADSEGGPYSALVG